MCVRMGLFTIAGKQCKGAINKNQFRTHISPFTPFYRPLIPPARDIRNFFSSLFFFSGKSGEEEICSWAQPKVESKKGGREKEKTLISGESGVCVRALFFSWGCERSSSPRNEGVVGSRNEGEEQETRRDKFQRIFFLEH